MARLALIGICKGIKRQNEFQATNLPGSHFVNGHHRCDFCTRLASWLSSCLVISAPRSTRTECRIQPHAQRTWNCDIVVCFRKLRNIALSPTWDSKSKFHVTGCARVSIMCGTCERLWHDSRNNQCFFHWELWRDWSMAISDSLVIFFLLHMLAFYPSEPCRTNEFHHL